MSKAQDLAKELHEAIRGKVSRYKEWEELDEPTRAVFIAQAQHTLDTYALLPLDNVHACSGCRALTSALNDMDESRRQVVAGRDVMLRFLECTTEMQLDDRGKLEKLRDQLKEEDGDPEDKAMAISMVQFILDAESSMLVTVVITNAGGDL